MQNLAFPGREAVDLPREGLRLRYRVVIHKGNLSRSELENLYQSYNK